MVKAHELFLAARRTSGGGHSPYDECVDRDTSGPEEDEGVDVDRFDELAETRGQVAQPDDG